MTPGASFWARRHCRTATRGTTLYGLNGDDILDGGEGNDIMYGGNGSDAILGGAGDDRLIPGIGEVNSVSGGDGFDTLVLGVRRPIPLHFILRPH